MDHNRSKTFGYTTTPLGWGGDMLPQNFLKTGALRFKLAVNWDNKCN